MDREELDAVQMTRKQGLTIKQFRLNNEPKAPFVPKDYELYTSEEPDVCEYSDSSIVDKTDGDAWETSFMIDQYTIYILNEAGSDWAVIIHPKEDASMSWDTCSETAMASMQYDRIECCLMAIKVMMSDTHHSLPRKVLQAALAEIRLFNEQINRHK